MNKNLENKYKSLNHCRYLIQFHIIWCAKYRYPVLNPQRQKKLKDILINIANTYDYEIKEMEIMPDHIHIFIGCKPTVKPTDLVRTLKSITAREMFKNDLALKNFYNRCKCLWSRRYFISTIGYISEETVKRYIQNQHNFK